MGAGHIWAHSINATARHSRLGLYACPEDGLEFGIGSDHPLFTWFGTVHGNYVVNWGNTNYGQKDMPFHKVINGGAPFTFKEGVPMKTITDGTSKTLMMSECIVPLTADDLSGYGGSGVNAIQGSISVSKGGQTFSDFLTPNASLPDVATRICPDPQDLDGISACIQVAPFWTAMFEQIFAARSKHAGGVNASRCDGSVAFYTDSIDVNGWRTLRTGASITGRFIVPSRYPLSRGIGIYTNTRTDFTLPLGNAVADIHTGKMGCI